MTKHPKIKIMTAANGLDYYVFCAANGRVLATSEMYSEGKIERAVQDFIDAMTGFVWGESINIKDARKKKRIPKKKAK